jgi:hypothetical protein
MRRKLEESQCPLLVEEAVGFGEPQSVFDQHISVLISSI